MSDLLNELKLIRDFNLRVAVAQYLDTVPKYFFSVPASSSGKYHPQYALGEGGLVRHTKAAVKIAEDLLSLEQYQNIADKHDEIITALIIHDTYKRGVEDTGTTVFEHPNIAAEKFVQFMFRTKPKCSIKQTTFICGLVRSHMGQWNKRDGVTLDKPLTKEQQFVHMCDYLASRKYLIVLGV